MSIFTRNQHLGLASLILSLSILLSRFMGLIRFKVISYFYGVNIDTDIYFAAFAIPDFINYLLAGGYFSITLIPLLSESFAKDQDDAWTFYSAVFNWVSLAILSLTVVAWIFAFELARFSFPLLSVSELERLTYYTRIILPAQAMFLPGACFTALLYLRKQFVVPALTPLIYNGSIILGGIGAYYFVPDAGMEGFCWGVVVGAGLGSLILPYFTALSGGLKLRLALFHPLLKRFIILALPLMLGQSIVALDEQMLRIFGGLAAVGSVSLLSYAQKVMQVPVAVFAQAAGAASYPFLASLAAKGDEVAFSETLARSLKNTFLMITPVAVLMIVTAEPIIKLLFEQGEFKNTLECAILLQIMLLVVPLWGVQQLLGRAFYSRQDTLTPAILGTITTAVSVFFYWQGAVRYGARGVAIATCIALFLYTFALIVVWSFKFGSRVFSGIKLTLLKSLGSSILAGLVSHFLFISIYYSNEFQTIVGNKFLFAFLTLCLVSFVFALVHLSCNKVLGLPFLPLMFFSKKNK
ncbi:murein biosynthesis integral membrane protein MurJ [Desulfovibrio litoralis]|uniref:Putative peptidoglycan lipid II flippase n=1 Tax=Desulfovibrio litoralis DSM 11393 TaxID=1121455 RepID=A0A1M7RU43_9BACT|nr:lipid II flippase MurJ [Desulfovibrio litoralis]SHN49805.1 putative peptidoglycan lipid II flippase [Desulfovibrio litoralis DSM 11393]